MTRRYGELVDVRRRDDAPAEFLWRGRLYVVRDVLAHWMESRPWWTPAEAPSDASADGGQPGGGQPAGDDREVWRVEASPGRVHGSGVYDLRFDWATGRWALDRVVD
jgi:hypothetical protein